MISTEDILSLSSCKSLSDVKELDLSNRDLKVLDPCCFKGLKNLESLDVSRNSIRDIPNLDLPKLQCLNVEENLINDLAFLKDYSELTELLVAGNPILSADKNIAVSLLPKLVLLDGADCQPLRKLEALGDKKLLPQISRVWESTFKDNLLPGASDEEVGNVKKDFLRHLRRSHFECNEFSVKFKKFKVETLGGELFEEEVQRIRAKASSTPKKKQDRSKSSEKPCSPSKRVASSLKVQHVDGRELVRSKTITDGSDVIVSSPRRGTRGLNKPTEVGALNGSPRKRVASPRKILHLEDQKPVPSISSLDEDNRNASLLQASAHELNGSAKNGLFDNKRRPCTPRKKLKYEVAPSKAEKGSVKGAKAHIFLRGHSQDPSDSVTQVWQAAFQPGGEENDLSPNIFASCGGRVVNFIDCSTGTIVKRYKSTHLTEEFFCLAWTVLPIGGHPSAVLAVAGKAREVSLIHPEQLVCYKSFQAHSKYINCLLFCPNQPTWLLSGSIDDSIHLWDIGVPKAPGYQTKIVNLLTLRPKCEILQLCVSTQNELLLAACHGGLFGWKFDQKSLVKVDRSPNIEFCLPTKDGASMEEEPVVDGLVLIEDDMIVSKCSNSGMIGMWKLSSHVASIRKFSQKLQKVKVEYRSTFLWSDTKVDYFYPSATADVIACGDDTGTIWLYNIGKKGATLVKPTAKLTWPDKLTCSDQVSVTKKDGKVNTNSVRLSPDGDYMVACTDINIVCIWRITR
ncbi:leucine-rich repeat and WD repeat-containing protein 1-like isoform X2 [Dermacentor albipictus]|uniref:leucine-rich repeat and WD repeat-containing protein 1-like isoform X2 n=1 Tax=Dermacentor albipictus TaxID=60249 RepID=UPI0031FC2292